MNSFSLPYKVVSLPWAETIDLNRAAVKIFVSCREVLALFCCAYNDIPFLPWFRFYVVSDTCSLQSYVIVLAVTYGIIGKLGSVCRTVVIGVYLQVTDGLIVFRISLSWLTWLGLGSLPNRVWKLIGTVLIIPYRAFIVWPDGWFNLWLIRNLHNHVPFLSIQVVRKVIFHALRGQRNSQGLALGNRIVYSFRSNIRASQWGNRLIVMIFGTHEVRKPERARQKTEQSKDQKGFHFLRS